MVRMHLIHCKLSTQSFQERAPPPNPSIPAEYN